MQQDEEKENIFLVKVNTVSSGLGDRKLSFDFSFIAMDRRIKKTTLKKTKFVEEAALNQSKELEKIYAKNAEFQFNKYLRR
mgnify:CR=1 FL=1